MSESKHIIVLELLDSDDYIIDIYSECDTISLASSSFSDKDDVLSLMLDENDEGIETMIMSCNHTLIYYKDKENKNSVIEFTK